ncbi:hypothetical protein [Halobacteriovorax sp. HLS]|uniref:hypothetical protein n=1 Tax=Halobacteriovorax sp. HLS TaxID=2234000 RepID=UPI000FD9D4C9|nr:hypothetical protein [Halobacteriovorax sp. HLS]
MKNELKEYFVLPQAMFFMYSSRAGMDPNDMLTKLQMTHEDLYPKLGGYALERKQYMSLLYKAGNRKSEVYLEKDKEDLLRSIETSELIAELERRTRN